MTMVSIVCPAFNEEDALPAFHQELLRVVNMLGTAYDVEILYVDDGSRDGTLFHLRSWASTDPRVRYLCLSRNFGHQAAVTAGMEHARGDAVVTMDSDLQHPPAMIPQLLAKWEEGYEIVVTIRTDYRTTSLKRMTSDWFFAFLRLISETGMQSGVSDFRLMSRKAVDSLCHLREAHRFLRTLIPWLGFPTAEVNFEVGHRAGGVSKFNYRRLVSLGFDALVSGSNVPLRLTVLVGLGMLTLGTGMGIVALVCWLLGKPIADLATGVTLVDLHLLGGAVLCALGILGEYIGRIFDQVRGRPTYLVKETDKDLAAGRVRFPPDATAEDKPGTAA
jgi:glycosyltransferase involved in cell wall biosynthesis